MASKTQRDGRVSGPTARPRSEDAKRDQFRRQEARAAAARKAGKRPRAQDETSRKAVEDADKIAAGRRRITNAPSGTGAVRTVTTQLSPVFAPLVVESILIVADEALTYHRAPIPSRFVAAFALFGGLSFAGGDWEGAARALGWSVVLATFYNVATHSPNVLSGIGAFFAGNGPQGVGNATPTTAGGDARNGQSNGEQLSGRGSFAPGPIG